MKFNVLLIALILTIFVFSNVALAVFGPTDGQQQTIQQTTQQTTQTEIQQTAIQTVDESGFKCGDSTTMKERIKCRINLVQENELNYLPEECRALSGLEKATCINNYKSTNRCFQQTTDSNKLNCARIAVGLQVANIQQNRDACAGNQTCMTDLKTKVFTLVKFRFYNLEEKAEKLKERGVSEDTVVNFINSLEDKKQQFNNAGTIDEKKQIVRDVIDLWKQFVDQAKTEIGAK